MSYKKLEMWDINSELHKHTPKHNMISVIKVFNIIKFILLLQKNDLHQEKKTFIHEHITFKTDFEFKIVIKTNKNGFLKQENSFFALP